MKPSAKAAFDDAKADALTTRYSPRTSRTRDHGDDGDAFGQRLRNQQTIEWVAVMLRQAAQHAQVGVGDIEEKETLIRHRLFEICEKPEPSECAFDRDLPKGGDADDDIVVRVSDLVTHSGGKPR